jgi:hypothetical protein
LGNFAHGSSDLAISNSAARQHFMRSNSSSVCPYRKPKTVRQPAAAAMEKRSKQQYAPRWRFSAARVSCQSCVLAYWPVFC